MVAALAIIAILSLAYNAILWRDARSKSAQMRMALQQLAVSYTHLTLPTIYSV